MMNKNDYINILIKICDTYEHCWQCRIDNDTEENCMVQVFIEILERLEDWAKEHPNECKEGDNDDI